MEKDKPQIIMKIWQRGGRDQEIVLSWKPRQRSSSVTRGSFVFIGVHYSKTIGDLRES